MLEKPLRLIVVAGPNSGSLWLTPVAEVCCVANARQIRLAALPVPVAALQCCLPSAADSYVSLPFEAHFS